MTLSNESTSKLAETIASDVFEVIKYDDRYLQGIMNALPSAIEDVIGKVSPELIGELGSMIMDKVGVAEPCHPYDKDNIWKTRYETLYSFVKRTYAESYVDGAEYGVSQYNDGVE